MVSTMALAISLVCSGLFAGLMLTLVIVLQRMWLAMTYERYILSMQLFLTSAKGHPIITALTLLPIVLPLFTLAEINTGWSLTITLALMGAVASLLVLIVTLRLNFPIYEAIMAWQPNQQPDDDWQAIRTRFYQLNLMRFVLSLMATNCFLLALIP